MDVFTACDWPWFHACQLLRFDSIIDRIYGFLAFFRDRYDIDPMGNSQTADRGL